MIFANLYNRRILFFYNLSISLFW